MRNNYRGRKEKVSLLLALLLASSLCLSIFFVSHHVEHEHEGQDCQVCAILQLARANFQNLSSTSPLSVQTQNFSLLIFSFSAISVFLCLKTLVSEKTRLNN